MLIARPAAVGFRVDYGNRDHGEIVRMKHGALAQKRQVSRSDSSLLRALSERNDKGALEELMQRYGRTAYNLAMRICSDPQMAEDVIQEVMLNLWRRAPSFDPRKGSARSWILRVVALRSLQMRRQEQRNSNRMARHLQLESPRSLRSENQDLERKEILVSMRTQLSRLPKKDRMLVTLYFGAELSQTEISRQLALPQRTVSYRLKQILERLEKGLNQAGLALAVPALDKGLLREAVCQELEVSPRLWDAFWEHFDYCAVDQSTREAPSHLVGSMKGALPWVAAFVLTLSVPGLMYVLSSPSKPKLVTPPAHIQDAESSVKSLPQTSLFSKAWTFEKGWPEELEILSGKWSKWAPQTGKQPALMVAPAQHKQVVVELPIVQRKVPVEVRVRAAFEDSRTGGVAFQWNAERAKLMYLKDRSFKGTRIEYAAYFIDRYMLHYLNGRLIRIKVYQRPYPSSQIFLRNNGLAVERISVRELPVADTPPECREVEKYVKRFLEDSKWCRVGSGGPSAGLLD